MNANEWNHTVILWPRRSLYGKLLWCVPAYRRQDGGLLDCEEIVRWAVGGH